MKQVNLRNCEICIMSTKRMLMSILVLLCVPFALANNHNYTQNANISPEGSGVVYVNKSDVDKSTISGWAESHSQEYSGSESNAVAYSFYIYAKANPGFFFEKWTGTPNGTSNPISNSGTLAANATSITKITTANFRPILEFPYGKSITLFTDPVSGEILPSSLQLIVNKATALKVESNSSSFSITSSSEISLNGGTDQAVTISITAVTGTAEGTHSGVIKLTPTNTELEGYSFVSQAVTLNVNIVPAPTLVFNPATPAVGGTYTYQQTNINPQPAPVTVNERKEIGLLNQNDGVIKLVATPAAGYRTYRWIIDYGGGNIIYDYLSGNVKSDDDCNFTQDAMVSVEFTEDKYASFFVKDDPSIKYNDLNLALSAAASYASKTVVVDPTYNNTAKCNGGYLRAGTYTIPDGYTLLVPADDVYTTLGHAQNCTSNEWAADGVTLPTKCYSKLIIEDGTTLNVDGVLCVYAKWNYGNSSPSHMKPGNYGWIEMEGNSVININEATLHAFGYITNAPTVNITKDNMNSVGRVVANNNAIIYEIFVMSDWRGGSALVGSTNKLTQLANLATIYGGGAAGMVKNSSKVFPMGQYYFQNVEVPLTLNPGAKAKVQMTVDAGVIAMATVDFIVPNDAAEITNSQIESGLLRLGDNTKLMRYYDKSTDRIFMYLDEYIKGGTHTFPTFFHTIVMNLVVGSNKIPVSSAEYTLPITNNLDITIGKNLNVDIVNGSDLAFLPGASMKIEENSKLSINSNVYIYDSNERVFHDITTNTIVNGKGYFSAYNGTLYRLPYRPNGVPTVRTESNIADSKWDINGDLHVNSALYTTAGGANITSSLGGGSVYFNAIGDKDTTAQGYQDGTVSFYQIPICNAKLHNADGTFSAGPSATAGQQYVYYNDLDGGKWSLPMAGISATTIPQLKITLPTQKSATGSIECTLTKPEGAADFTFEVSDFTVSIDDDVNYAIGTISIVDDKLIIPVTYSSQDVHGEYPTTITIKNSNTKFVLNKAIILTAIEDYQPQFTATAGTTAFTSMINDPVSTNVTFSIVENNVATIWSDATYGNRLTWTYTITGDNAADFSFAYGEDSNKLSGALLTFNPQTEGQNKSATLTLTASYLDGANPAQEKKHSIEILLTGNASLHKNTLAFATFPDPIYVDTEEFLLLDDATNNAKTPISFTITPADKIQIVGDGTTENPYKVKPLSPGVVEIVVNQQNSGYIEATTLTTSLTINSKDATLYPLDLCVDNQNIFDAHTVATQSAMFDSEEVIPTIVFSSKELEASIWEMQFKGVPNQVTFTLSGNNNWLVEQKSAADDAQWTSLLTSAGGIYTLALLPTTRYIRFTYAMGESVGKLSKLCITALDINASADKVYLPINVDATASSANFTLYHTHDITFNTLSELTVQSETTNSGTVEEPYFTTVVTILPNSNTIVDQEYSIIATDDNSPQNTKNVVIRTYRYPQELPIKLASDEIDRYYFVKDPTSMYTEWDASSREIVFRNPGDIQLRNATFAFEGAPYHISFKVDANIEVSDWVIRESEDGLTYTKVETEPIIEGNIFTQELNYKSKYVRIENNSTNMSEVRLSNLVIEGKPEMFAEPEELVFNKELTELVLTLTAVNLDEIRIELDDATNFAFKKNGDDIEYTTLTLTKENNAGLGLNKYCEIPLSVIWKAQNMIDDANLIVYNSKNDSVIASIHLLGAENYLVKENAEIFGIYSGVHPDYTYHGSTYTDYQYHQLNLVNTFAEDGTAMFDYLFIYGETTTTDDTKNITAPGNNGSLVGSNARTPYYIYKKVQNSLGEYKAYQFVKQIDNANTADKAIVDGVMTKDTATIYIDVLDSLRVYLTGFCPYATTGYTKEQEGVWLFRGIHGSKLDIYLEDCHIFSRNKTQNGNAFYGNKDGGKTFSEGFARGSGGVLVFENTSSTDQLHEVEPFEVNIHTIGNNLLKSNYGCFFILLESMKAYQISAPIHVHMASTAHIRTSKTTLNFDDLWPTTVNANNAITNTKRTNGYLGLKKQSNNAPSIDLGNPNTEVNFRGGQIELQNAQIVSPNYKTTLAISYRSGEYGGDETGIKLSYGIGTDSVGGTVNFYDGTTTVEPMKVAQEYRQYYLMDTLADGTESEYTSCLRTPKNTYVYGGSLCRVRACQHVTSKGGAPKDGPNGRFLGQYIYKLQESDVVDVETKLAKSIQFPLNLTSPNLKDYYDSQGYTYGLYSVSPDSNNQLYFWIPDGYGNVSAEVDKFLSTWKACMTEIRAGLGGIVEGAVGGDTPIEPNEEVKYLLYCKIDQNIHDVISAGEGEGDGKKYSYKAPVEVPSVASSYFDGAEYTKIAPTYISDSVEYQVLSDTTYTVTDKVYYVTTATADVWQTFTAPFDVEKIWVVEPFSEVELEKKGTRNQILLEQARHNADFAAFFAVAMAIGTSDSFEEIFDSYIKWAKIQDDSLGLYSGGEYALRGKYELIPYDGTNWATAQFYLNLNKDNWQLTTDEDGNEVFDVKWEIPTVGDDGILLHKDSTYSLLFPYCTGCWDYDEEGNFIERTMWDYWSGKFLIFESTSAPQTINGRDFLNDTIPGNIFSNKPNSGEVIMTGNSTFSFMNVADENIYIYSPVQNDELFLRNSESEELSILPTTAFLYGEVPTNAQNMPARSISRTGKINYGKGNTPSGVQNGNIPTINGGSDIFVTTIANGINIAVAAPQLVRVLSSSGALLFNGWVEASVDVTILGNGIFVVSGENTSLKVLH